jgi:hypothetical protein
LDELFEGGDGAHEVFELVAGFVGEVNDVPFDAFEFWWRDCAIEAEDRSEGVFFEEVAIGRVHEVADGDFVGDPVHV